MPRLMFSHKLILSASLILLLAFGSFTGFSYLQLKETLDTQLKTYVRDAGTLTTINIADWLNNKMGELELEAGNIGSDFQASEVLDNLSKPLLKEQFAVAYFGVERDGTFIDNDNLQLPAGYDPRQRPWYQKVRSERRSTITEPYSDAFTGELLLTAASPAYDEGSLIGVLGGDLSLKSISDVVNTLNFNDMGYAFLVSKSGKVLIHPQSELQDKSLSDVFESQALTLQPELQQVNVDGDKQLVAFYPLQQLQVADWYLGVVIDADKAFAAAYQLRNSALISMLAGLVLILLLLRTIIGILMRPLKRLALAMQEISSGEADLTQRLVVEGEDEFGELSKHFNHFVGRIERSIIEVNTATLLLTQEVEEVLQSTHDNLRRMEHQNTRTQSIATAIHELEASAQEIARNASSASQQASQARETTLQGQRVVGNTVTSIVALSEHIQSSSHQIGELNTQTDKIGSILEVIRGISEQTNLLALNAAIEAARAGEAGRGFAVVADEVRNLAYRTQESTEEIQSMIESLQSGAQAAVGEMRASQESSARSHDDVTEAGQLFDHITRAITEIDGVNQSVATATEEQTSVAATLDQDITEINQSHAESGQNLKATLEACQALQTQAANLAQLVGSFKISA